MTRHPGRSVGAALLERPRATAERSPRAGRIGVLGHVGNGNLGDEAIFAAVIQNLRSRQPAATLVAFTANPRDTRIRHRLPAFPIRRTAGSPGRDRTRPPGPRALASSRTAVLEAVKRTPLLGRALRAARGLLRTCVAVPLEVAFLARSLPRVARLDLLVVAGSGQLYDGSGGSWGFPYTLFKWSVLARLGRTRLVFLGTGAGPIDAPLSRLFIRRALALADYRSYRDESSRALVERIGFGGPHGVAPDLAFGLEPSVADGAGRFRRGRPVVGLNPMPLFARHYWPVHDEAVYNSYADTLAAFARWLAAQGYDVRFFPSQVWADPPVIDDIVSRMAALDRPSLQRVIHERVTTLEHLLDQIRQTDLVVATRYHGVLLSALLHRPVIAISYHRKTNDLMTLLGQANYVVDVAGLDLPTLTSRFTSLASRSGLVEAALRQHVADCRSALSGQYSRVLEA